ncbi:CsgG/HfaB family protein [Plebeiibacterium sediminum]|uniref:CsgG/HfaB family protein n=1 Tax=Plebeiibacterium sediminum TaxID=2992112 RepID=A0AAE3M1Z7_9BACT|nr:CsgG/HfaB family protein [Plebeiobacterium sediminum]MCW3785481.1 CsgG/HfaB family protein [Plebeiobacterium sediminum]
MKHLFLIIFCFYTLSLVAQDDKKVAVFDPDGEVANGIKSIVREEISNAIVNTPSYTVVERTMIEKVLAEAQFQSKGLVDDSQISKLGKMMGADLVCYGSVVPLGNNFYISLKMVDVITAKVILQATGSTQQGTNDLIQVSQQIANKLVKNANYVPQQQVQAAPVKKNPLIKTPPGENSLLIAIRPDNKSELAKAIIDKITLRFGESYTIQVANQVSNGSVSYICGKYRAQYNCKHIALITLKESSKEVYYIAETLNTSTKRREGDPVKKVLKTKHLSTDEIINDLVDNFNHLLK